MQQNPELALAKQFIETTGTHLFLTGKAGTGKTTFLRQLCEQSPKRMIVLAPTGIAAINAGGVTIHSFFQLPFAPYVPESSFRAGEKASYRFRFGKEKIRLMRSIDLLVIDEISMVRADLLDAVDDVMRRYRRRDKPFGGVQLLMIGDLQQLAPVIRDEEWRLLKDYYDTPYFFSSHALCQTTYCTIELKTVYRQADSRFLELLNAIRENRCTPQVLQSINSRYLPQFEPPPGEGYIRLMTHNAQAQRINDRELEQLPGRVQAFKAEVTGNFPEMSYPTDAMLELKRGAQVMFVKNDSTGNHRYFNGMIGEVTDFGTEGIEVRPKGGDNALWVKPEEWTNAKYVLDEESKEIVEEIEGTFRQYPLKLAWAITIHKSQGLTFDRAIIDAAASFAHGQTYVALSRCKTLEGMVLSAPITERAVINDAAVDRFTDDARRSVPDACRFGELQRSYYIELLTELYGFFAMEDALRRVVRVIDEHLYKTFPQLLESYKEKLRRFHEEVTVVAQRFELQYRQLVEASGDYARDTMLQQRLHSGAVYFADKMAPLHAVVEAHIEIDNKVVRKQYDEAMADLCMHYRLKCALLHYVAEHGFHTIDYLREKAVITLQTDDKAAVKGKGKATQAKSSKAGSKVVVPTDIARPELYEELIAWRNARAAENHAPVYTVLQQKAILGIANLLPLTTNELYLIPYLGKTTIDKYGEALLEIVKKYQSANE